MDPFAVEFLRQCHSPSHTHTHTHTHSHSHAHTHTHTRFTRLQGKGHTHIHTNTYAHTALRGKYQPVTGYSPDTNTRIRTHARTYTHTHTYTLSLTHAYTRIEELYGDLAILLIDVRIFLSPQQNHEVPKSLLEQVCAIALSNNTEDRLLY
jgi:hypothetical protein